MSLASSSIHSHESLCKNAFSCCWPLPTKRPTYGTQERINAAGLFKRSPHETACKNTFFMLLAAAYPNRPRNVERNNVADRFKHSLTMTLTNHTVCIICELGASTRRL
jgi:hypothetical protein